MACEHRSRFPRQPQEPPAFSSGSRPACFRLSDRSARRYRYRQTRTWDNGVRSLPDQVAAFILGAIEGLIGERDEVVGAMDAIVGERREADADGQVQRIFAGIGEVTRHEAPPQPLGENPCASASASARRFMQPVSASVAASFSSRCLSDTAVSKSYAFSIAETAVLMTVSANCASARVSGGSSPVVRRKNTPFCRSFMENGSATAERVGTLMPSVSQRTRSLA